MEPDSLWANPSAGLALADDAVHVWRAELDVSPAQVERLRQLLSVDEADRACRFHFERDRQRFIVGRGLLRMIVSRYVLQSPDSLRFDYTEYGKPYLAAASGQQSLAFNVSHSDELALFALSHNRELGVDIERVRPTIEYEQIAARFFSSSEYEQLCALPPAHRMTAFYRCWTRKEAYIKARGGGLSVPLDSFAVSLEPAEPVRLLYTLDDPLECSRWSLHNLSPGPGYQAALAVAGHGWQLICWQWLEPAA